MDRGACDCHAASGRYAEGARYAFYPAPLSHVLNWTDGDLPNEPAVIWVFQGTLLLQQGNGGYGITGNTIIIHPDQHFSGATYEVYVFPEEATETGVQVVNSASPQINISALLSPTYSATSDTVLVFQGGIKLTEGAGAYALQAGIVYIDNDQHFDGARYTVFVFRNELTVADFLESQTGYYLTDPEWGYPMRDGALANRNCFEDDLWQVLYNARANALRDFEVEFSSMIREMRRTKMEYKRYRMGKLDTGGRKVGRKAIQGLAFVPKRRYSDAVVRVEALHTNFNVEGAMTVIIASNSPYFTPIRVQVYQRSNQWVQTPTEIFLPAWDGITDGYRNGIEEGMVYYIYPERQGLSYTENRIYCCGGKVWPTNTCDTYGFATDDPTFQDMSQAANLAYGFALDVSLTCSPNLSLCNVLKGADVGVKGAIGRAITLKAGIGLMERDRNSGKVNQYSLLNPETRATRIKAMGDAYKDTMQWLVTHFPTSTESCIGCPSGWPVAMSKI